MLTTHFLFPGTQEVSYSPCSLHLAMCQSLTNELGVEPLLSLALKNILLEPPSSPFPAQVTLGTHFPVA